MIKLTNPVHKILVMVLVDIVVVTGGEKVNSSSVGLKLGLTKYKQHCTIILM